MTAKKRLWEDCDRRDEALEAEMIANQQPETTLLDLITTATYAVVRLFKKGEKKLLRQLAEAIPVSEFDNPAQRADYIESFLLGEEDPTRCAMVLLYQGVFNETLTTAAAAKAQREALNLNKQGQPRKRTPNGRNGSGLRGVGMHRGKWRAEVSQLVHGVRYKKYLGGYEEKQEAAQRHDAWVRQHIGTGGKLSDNTVVG